MQYSESINPVRLARFTGSALLATVVMGILVSIFIAAGIGINLNADVQATAQAML